MDQLQLDLNGGDARPREDNGSASPGGGSGQGPPGEPPSRAAEPSPSGPRPGEPPSSGTPSRHPPRPAPCAIVRELERIVASGGRGRRIIVARTRGEGRELLRQVSLRGGSWIGFEATTPRRLAMKYAAGRLARAGTRIVDLFEERALIEEAIDEVMASELQSPFRNQTERMGFRDAVRNSVVALRLAGVRPGPANPANRPETERARRRPSSKQLLVTRVLRAFESLMRARNRTDTAGVLRRAAQALRTGRAGSAADGAGPERVRAAAAPAAGSAGPPAPASDSAAAGHPTPPPRPQIILLPGLGNRGLAGRFLRELQRLGARVLPTDPALGLDLPDGVLRGATELRASGSLLHAVATDLPDGAPELEIDLFCAASVNDELRGVLRRAVQAGARWDQIEIVAADPAAYGSALHALADSMGIPVTFAVGLPVERTRPGRVVSTWFRWVRSGFQESVIRALIESDDIRPPRPHRSDRGPWLARALRRQRIGWGRGRYQLAINRALAALERAPAGRFESEEQLARRKEREGRRLRALRALLYPVIDAIPTLPTPIGRIEGTDFEPPQSSPAEVAHAISALLRRVRPGTETDESARKRLEGVLERIEATVTRKTDFASAAAIVESCLAIRVPTPRTEGMAPWNSAPGHIHLADLRHGGATGRPFTFVVGLDATALSGALHEDPLLGDRERRRLAGRELPMAADRAQEARFDFAHLFARLRGTVALSYASWNPCESRKVTPAPEMLQALRLKNRDPSLDFHDLEECLGNTESRLPRTRNQVNLDRSDVWLRALAAPGDVLLGGIAAVSREFPHLGAGLAVQEALDDDWPTVHTGFLGEHDPPLSYQTMIQDATLSASALEALGSCPRRFLFRRILHACPPDDPEFDPDRWLNALERGRILHRVFEETLREADARGLRPDADAFREIALEVVDREAERALLEVPTPSVAVHEWEVESMRNDARSFVEMIRDEAPRWSHLEWRFGFGKELRIPVGKDSLSVRGAVDRVDESDGRARVVDYKTGGYWQSAKSKTYDGGRRLQHTVYAAAVAAGLGLPVEAMEYHYPSRKGENRIRAYPVSELAEGGRLIGAMLEGPAKGWFPATEKATDDCRFCDYTEVCGVVRGKWDRVDCRISEWTARNMGEHDELEPFARVRNWEKKPKK